MEKLVALNTSLVEIGQSDAPNWMNDLLVVSAIHDCSLQCSSVFYLALAARTVPYYNVEQSITHDRLDIQGLKLSQQRAIFQ